MVYILNLVEVVKDTADFNINDWLTRHKIVNDFLEVFPEYTDTTDQFQTYHRRAVRQDELVNTKLMTSNDNYSVKVPKSTRLSEYFEDSVKAATVWYVNLPQI